MRANQTPCEAIETMKLPALIMKNARYNAENTTVHHEVKTRKRSRSEMA